MGKKNCALGLRCGELLNSEALSPPNCPNFNACLQGSKRRPDESFLLQVADVAAGRPGAMEVVPMTRTQAATIMLKMRGGHHVELQDELRSLLQQIQDELSAVESSLDSQIQGYVAPKQVQSHVYSVKRSGQAYAYNKLSAKEAVFRGAQGENFVKTLHLGRDDDARNTEARLGIERRNQLLQVATLLKQAKGLLSEAAKKVEGNSLFS